MEFDIYLVGVGGQGILTIGEILAEAVCLEGTPVSFFPSKGMSQRGGFVKAQLRIGRKGVGPNIAEKSADLVISMELSEALKAVRFTRPGGDFMLLEDRWMPVPVIMKKETYPDLGKIKEQILLSKSRLHYITSGDIPSFEGAPVPPNIFMLGVAMQLTPLGKLVKKDSVLKVIHQRWTKAEKMNNFAFMSGYETHLRPTEA